MYGAFGNARRELGMGKPCEPRPRHKERNGRVRDAAHRILREEYGHGPDRGLEDDGPEVGRPAMMIRVDGSGPLGSGSDHIEVVITRIRLSALQQLALRLKTRKLQRSIALSSSEVE